MDLLGPIEEEDRLRPETRDQRLRGTDPGVAGLLYVTTGIHGGHVLLGMVLILLYTIQACTYTPYTAASTDTVHGILSIILY